VKFIETGANGTDKPFTPAFLLFVTELISSIMSHDIISAITLIPILFIGYIGLAYHILRQKTSTINGVMVFQETLRELSTQHALDKITV